MNTDKEAAIEAIEAIKNLPDEHSVMTYDRQAGSRATGFTTTILKALVTDYEASAERIETLEKALRDLVDMARTSGGTAGRDEALCVACEKAEAALGKDATTTTEAG